MHTLLSKIVIILLPLISRLERERLERERIEVERVERERLRMERERRERERLELEREEARKAEQMRYVECFSIHKPCWSQQIMDESLLKIIHSD